MKYHIRCIARCAPRCGMKIPAAGAFFLTIAAIISRDIPSDEVCKRCLDTLTPTAAANLTLVENRA